MENDGDGEKEQHRGRGGTRLSGPDFRRLTLLSARARPVAAASGDGYYTTV